MAMAGERRRVLFGATDLPLLGGVFRVLAHRQAGRAVGDRRNVELDVAERELRDRRQLVADRLRFLELPQPVRQGLAESDLHAAHAFDAADQREPATCAVDHAGRRSEEHTSELQSLMRISYAVFCLKKKKTKNL